MNPFRASEAKKGGRGVTMQQLHSGPNAVKRYIAGFFFGHSHPRYIAHCVVDVWCSPLTSQGHVTYGQHTVRFVYRRQPNYTIP